MTKKVKQEIEEALRGVGCEDFDFEKRNYWIPGMPQLDSQVQAEYWGESGQVWCESLVPYFHWEWDCYRWPKEVKHKPAKAKDKVTVVSDGIRFDLTADMINGFGSSSRRVDQANLVKERDNINAMLKRCRYQEATMLKLKKKYGVG